MAKQIGEIFKHISLPNIQENIATAPKIAEKLSDVSPVIRKQIDAATNQILNPTQIQDAMFNHSIFCQTFFPYRNPGDDVTLWEQKQGNASLAIQTTKQKNPLTEEWETVGLPYGTRSRLITTYINTQAIKSQSQVIDVEENLTTFIQKLGLPNNGRAIQEVKEQLRRINASMITLGFMENNLYIPIEFKIVKSFDIWFQKDTKQKHLWNSKICLSDDYFNSLVKHAIPLDEKAIAALANSAMDLDVYCWLAQRLHRIPLGERQFITWQAIKEQFGQNYAKMNHFKASFRKTLKSVILQYHDARHAIEEDLNKGFYLKNAPAPIEKKYIPVSNLIK
jgi:Plasmid encoded RepA protein